MHPVCPVPILGNPQYPGSHLSHLSPPTPGRHAHCPFSSHRSETDPNLLQPQVELVIGHPSSLGPVAIVLPSAQHPNVLSEQCKSFLSSILESSAQNIEIMTFFCMHHCECTSRGGNKGTQAVSASVIVSNLNMVPCTVSIFT
jgi:hypothetical protein